MRCLRPFIACFVFVLYSCSGINQDNSATFEEYIKKNDPALTQHMSKSKERARKKMLESFSYVDRAALSLEQQGNSSLTRSVLYAEMQKVINDLYLEYEKRETTEPLDTLSKSIYARMNKTLMESGECTEHNLEKYLVLETNREAWTEFQKVVKSLFPQAQKQSDIEKFMVAYSTGFYIYRQDDPEDFAQFWRDAINKFYTSFYLLMTDALEKYPPAQEPS